MAEPSGAAVFPAGFFKRLLERWTVVAPVTGVDGVTRLQETLNAADSLCTNHPRFPLKKYLLPDHELLWICQDGKFHLPPVSTSGFVVINVAPCDLYALAYLDAAYGDDPFYQERRKRLLLVGGECTSSIHCHCPVSAVPPLFDLFFADGSFWIGSELGEQVFFDCADEALIRKKEPLPAEYWVGKTTLDIDDLSARFLQSLDDPLWAKAAEHCLSCGACSAVCPTCACYDVVDQVVLGGEITRQRLWDNCFFRNHGVVAGGHNFRADRTARLRFRFEHKYLGFGAQRGVSSCVGCGRCLDVCPVGISLAQILADLPQLEGKI